MKVQFAGVAGAARYWSRVLRIGVPGAEPRVVRECFKALREREREVRGAFVALAGNREVCVARVQNELMSQAGQDVVQKLLDGIQRSFMPRRATGFRVSCGYFTAGRYVETKPLRITRRMRRQKQVG